ncbi:MAG: hypothetical protein ACLT2T_17540 [Bilophila wadsworthia]
MLVVRDFISALYELYPEISSKGNAGNMAAAIEYMNRSAPMIRCTSRPR